MPRLATRFDADLPGVPMPAFGIFIRETTHDHSELAVYTSKAPASMVGHPIKVLAAYGHHEILEGPDVEGVAIIEFPSIEEAKAWYESPAYREAREHRFRGASYRAILVDGVYATRD